MDSNLINSKELDELAIVENYTCPIEHISNHININNTDLKIISQNICSIYCNLDDLLVTLTKLQTKVDVLILTECSLNLNKSIPHMHNYSSFFTTKHINKCDGVVFYVNNCLSTSVEEIVLKQASCLQITVNNVIILGIYRSPSNTDAAEFLDSLDKHLATITSAKNVVIAGDLNINLIPKVDEHSHVVKNRNKYLNMLAMRGILPGHRLPTRKSSCLDHYMLKLDMANISAAVAVLDTTVTDHYMIFLKISNIINRNNLSSKTKTSINYDKALLLIRNSNLHELHLQTNPTILTELLINSIKKCLLESTILKPIPCSVRLIKPWMTLGLLRCIRNRNDMQRKLRSDLGDNNILKITYRRYRNFVTNCIKQLKRKYDREKFNNVQKHPKKLWRAIDNFTNRKNNKSISSKLLQIKSSPMESVNYVNNYFCNVGRILAENICTGLPNSQPNSCIMNESFALLKTDCQEVYSTLMNLKSDSAPGWDNIPTKFLKMASEHVVPIITHLANLCFEQGIFPPALKCAIITPVHKSGDKNTPCNYRPISVLTAISKIIEKLMNSRLVSYLNRNDILSSTQYGFRQGVSTEDAVATLASRIVTQVDSGKKCVVVFLDLKNAFDTVSIPILVHRLEEIGIRSTQLQLFGDYLCDRKQRVKIGDIVSEEEDVIFGVPQGSVMGPTLFLIYINSLCKMKLENGHVLCYADDTAVLFTGHTWESVRNSAEKGLRKITNWFNSNLLTLNMTKTNYICFTINNTTQPNNNFTIKIHTCVDLDMCSCEAIEKVASTKYLGIVVDQRLSWHQHIELVTARVRNLIWIFKKLRHVLDKSLIGSIYVALAQSVMSYCLPVWGGANKTNFLYLEKAQRSLLKVIYFKPYKFSTEILYLQTNVLTVRKLFVLHTILSVHKTLHLNPALLGRRRHYQVADVTRVRTTYAQRQFVGLSTYLYNLINKTTNIYSKTSRECKKTLGDWLKIKTYDEIEALIKMGE